MQDVECSKAGLTPRLPGQGPPWSTFAATNRNIAPRQPFQIFLHDALSITSGNVSTISGRDCLLPFSLPHDVPGLIISPFFPSVEHDMDAEAQEFLSDDGPASPEELAELRQFLEEYEKENA